MVGLLGALTPEEQYGEGLLAPMQRGHGLGLLGGIRQLMGPSVMSRMQEANTAQQARLASGERSPTPLTEENMWLADDVAGGLLGPMAFAAPIKAFHGSPHRFDKFSLEKIGTGEGAQAYGHGLYFAENPAVAGDYRKTLAGYNYETPDGVFRSDELFAALSSRDEQMALQEAIRVNDWDKAKARFDREGIPGAAAAIDKLRGEVDLGNIRPQGALYTTRLNVEPEDLLDWDKPLSEQSEKVRAAVLSAFDDTDLIWKAHDGTETNLSKLPEMERIVTERTARKIGGQFGTARELAKQEIGKGESAYKLLANHFQSPAEASAALREAGIPGIRYLDQGSRASGEGTRNFVIFDDSLVDIEGID